MKLKRFNCTIHKVRNSSSFLSLSIVTVHFLSPLQIKNTKSNISPWVSVTLSQLIHKIESPLVFAYLQGCNIYTLFIFSVISYRRHSGRPRPKRSSAFRNYGSQKQNYRQKLWLSQKNCRLGSNVRLVVQFRWVSLDVTFQIVC